jgi:ABC-type uncharacterized transport system auxiliary subunit
MISFNSKQCFKKGQSLMSKVFFTRIGSMDIKLSLSVILCLALLACGGNTRQNTLGDLKYKAKEEKEIEFAKTIQVEIAPEVATRCLRQDGGLREDHR